MMSEKGLIKDWTSHFKIPLLEIGTSISHDFVSYVIYDITCINRLCMI